MLICNIFYYWAKEAGDVELTQHSMLVRSKGVRGDGGERLLTAVIDKQFDVSYNFTIILLMINILLLTFLIFV